MGDPVIRPYGDHVVTVEDPDRPLISGLVVPENARVNRWRTGTVERVGPGPRVRATGLREGDRVAYPSYLGVQVRPGVVILEAGEVTLILGPEETVGAVWTSRA